MVIRTQKIARPKRMVSQSRLSTPATPSRQPSACLRQRRRSRSHHLVDYEGHEGGVDQKRHDHPHQPPAPELDGIRQDAAVELDEQPRVDEHHEPAPRRGEEQQYQRLDARPYDNRAPDAYDPHDRSVELALAPELALGQEVHLQRVGREPADPVHNSYVGREEDREAGQVEEILEPDPYQITEGLGLLPDESDISLRVRLDAKNRVEEHRESDEHHRACDVEGNDLLLVCHLPPVPPAAHVRFVHLELVADRRLRFLLAGDRGDDPGDEYPHAQTLVADVVALHEVVAATGSGEDYPTEYRRSPDLSEISGQVRRALWGLGDDARPGRQVGGDDYGQ